MRKIKHEAHKFIIISGTWFWIPTITYAVALVICFICNIAVNGTLSWFFIVFASLLCAYSFIPTFTSFFEANKLLVFVVSSLASISILLLTCAIYTGAVFWVATACVGIMIGYSLLFVPVVLAKTDLRKYRFVIAIGAAFVLTVLLLLCSTKVQAQSLYDAIKPANPVTNSAPSAVVTPVDFSYFEIKKVTLSKNDVYNQYAIGLNRFATPPIPKIKLNALKSCPSRL